MKKLFFLLALVFTMSVDALADVTEPIPFRVIRTTSPNGHNPKSPIVAPTVYIDDNVLTFETPCDGCVLQLVDANDDVVYSIVIPAGTTSLILPSTLSGTFELQIIDGNILYYADIEL